MNDDEYRLYINESKTRPSIMDKNEEFVFTKIRAYPDVSSTQIHDWIKEAYKENYTVA